MRSKRAKRRGKGKRKEAVKAEQKLMWAKLSGDEIIRNVRPEGIGFFYCPYIPIMRPGGFGPIVTDTTA